MTTTPYEKSERFTAQGSASSSLDDIGEATSRMQRQAGQQLDLQMDRMAAAIRNKPLQSAAIAAGIGFLFALIARR